MYKLLGVMVIALLIMIGYGYKMNKDVNARQAALKAKIEQHKNQQLLWEEEKLQEKKIKEFEDEYLVDYREARDLVKSPKISESSRQFYSAMSSKWTDALSLASSTSRIALAPQVKNMQDLRRELEAKNTDNFCDLYIKNSLLFVYQSTIDSFMKFMTQDESGSELSLDIANREQEKTTKIYDFCTAK